MRCLCSALCSMACVLAKVLASVYKPKYSARARKPYVLLPECRILPSGPDIANLQHVELQERGALFDPRVPTAMRSHGALNGPTSSRHISSSSSTEYAELLDGDASSGALPYNADECPSPFNSPLTSISSSPSL